MTVTYQPAAAYAAGTTSCTPAYPASLAAGDLIFLACTYGNSTDATPATPSGFTLIPNSNLLGGSGSYGTDTGNRGVIAWIKISDGTETGTITVNNGGSGSTATISAQMTRATKSAAAWWVSATTGTDNSSDTSYSATGSVALIPANGDLGFAVAGLMVDTATVSSQTLTWDGVATTATQVNQVANTSGADQRFVWFRRNLAGTGGSAPIFAATLAVAAAGPTAFILIHDGAAPVLSVANGTHTHTATSPTLTQHQGLAVDSAAHAHSSTSPTLTQHHALAVDSASHAHTASNVTLTTAGATPVEPDDATHAHEATSPTLTQHQVLSVDGGAHAHSATSPTLVQHHALSVDGSSHAHTATEPTLTQHHALVLADALHTHSATSPTLTQHQALTVDGAAHAHAATSPDLTQHHALAVDVATHSHSATSPTLTQHHALVVDDATHGHTATSPTVMPVGVAVQPDDAIHTHVATSPTLQAELPRNITVSAELAPSRYAATISPARQTAELAGATHTATIAAARHTAAIAPARHTARIEAT